MTVKKTKGKNTNTGKKVAAVLGTAALAGAALALANKKNRATLKKTLTKVKTKAQKALDNVIDTLEES